MALINDLVINRNTESVIRIDDKFVEMRLLVLEWLFETIFWLLAVFLFNASVDWVYVTEYKMQFDVIATLIRTEHD